MNRSAPPKTEEEQKQSKLLPSCSLPLTGVGCVTRVVTNLAALEIKDGAFHLLERAPGVSVEEIEAATAGKLVVEGDIPEMQLDQVNRHRELDFEFILSLDEFVLSEVEEQFRTKLDSQSS